MNDARRAYQEAAVRGAKPVRLTIMLYEQVIQDIGRSSEAIARQDFETCAHEISHAVGVIGYLQATLKTDAGGPVARNLARFYGMIREKLLEAQVRSSREVLDELRRLMLDVREAWLKVEADTNDHTAA
jgi:flagellar biosynthetic protein FliS